MDNTSPEACALPAASNVKSVGAALAAARIARGASVEDVSRVLKLSVAQINAIEADDHSRLPAPVFVRGFIRSYARLLDVDVAPMLPAVPPTITPSDERLMHYRPGVTLQPKRGAGVRLMLGGALSVLLGLAYYEFVLNAPATSTLISAAIPARDGPPANAQVMQPGGSVRGPVAAVAEAQGGIRLPADNLQLKKSEDPASGASEGGLHFQFNGESWVEVRGSDGKVVFSMVNAPGSERIVRGNPPFTLVIGGASGVQLSYKGSRVDLASYVTSDVARLRLE